MVALDPLPRKKMSTLIPQDGVELDKLIAKELVIVRNLPTSLSSDTVCKFLEFYGPIEVGEKECISYRKGF
jgi:hypothetical protein